MKPNNRNPWFNEYLQEYHNCTYNPKNTNLSDCKNANTKNFVQQQYIHFIRDAVYAFAHAIHNLHKKSCNSFSKKDRLCSKFKEKVFVDLVKYLEEVTFSDPENSRFTFRFHGHNDSYRFVFEQFTQNLNW